MMVVGVILKAARCSCNIFLILFDLVRLLLLLWRGQLKMDKAKKARAKFAAACACDDGNGVKVMRLLSLFSCNIYGYEHV